MRRQRWTPEDLRQLAAQHDMAASISDRPEFHYRQARVARALAVVRESVTTSEETGK